MPESAADRSAARVGVSGTRFELTGAQRDWLRERIVALLPISELHHGCCTGADAFAHAVAIEHGIDTHVHPPIDASYLARECLATATVVYPARPYLERNRAIVAAVDVLLAVPAEVPNPRSGTMATVRYARKAGIPRYIYPASEWQE